MSPLHGGHTVCLCTFHPAVTFSYIRVTLAPSIDWPPLPLTCTHLDIASHLPPSNGALSWSLGGPAHTPPDRSAVGCLVAADGGHHSALSSRLVRRWDVGGLWWDLKWCRLTNWERVKVGDHSNGQWNQWKIESQAPIQVSSPFVRQTYGVRGVAFPKWHFWALITAPPSLHRAHISWNHMHITSSYCTGFHISTSYMLLLFEPMQQKNNAI